MDLTGLTALIVEDECIVALDVENNLSRAGANVILIAASVEEALAVLATQVISFAVLDVNLGCQTSQAVAAHLSGLGIPYIFYTANECAPWMHAPVVSKSSARGDLLKAVCSVMASGSIGGQGFVR